MKKTDKLLGAAIVGVVALGIGSNAFNKKVNTDPPGGDGTLATITCTGESVTVNQPGIIALQNPEGRRIGSAGIWEPNILGIPVFGGELSPAGVVGDNGYNGAREDNEGTTEVLTLKNPLLEGSRRVLELRVTPTGNETDPSFSYGCKERG